ncbi:MAG: DnaJ domain-containing protein, partial [Marinicellaceae bacterium]
MNPWKTLNIDPTDDKKIIKKAYAKLIKQYKPDEYPEKFQEIQQAYQMALSSMHYNQKIIENQESSQINDEIIKESKKETFELSEKKLFEHKQDSAFQKQQQELIDNLYAQLHAMAFAPLVVKNKLDNWKFIEDFYQIDDLTLKDEVAKTVFKKVAEYNLFQMKQNNTLLINPVTLSYFDKTFDWRTKWGEYVNVFPDHYFK